MDKLEGLRAGVAEMRSVAQRLNQWADDLEASFQPQAAPAEETDASAQAAPAGRKKSRTDKAGKASSAPAAEKTAAEGMAEKPLTLPEVRAKLAEKCAAGFKTQVKALIESYGVPSLAGVPPEKYGELLEAAEGLGDRFAG